MRGTCELRKSGRGERGFDPKRSLGLWKSRPSMFVISRRTRQAKPAGDARYLGQVGCHHVFACHGPSPMTARITRGTVPTKCGVALQCRDSPIVMITTQSQTSARLLFFVACEKFSYQHGNENGHVQLAGKADEYRHGSGQVGNGRHVAKTHGSQGNERQIEIVAELR